jgi:transposase
MNYVGIDLHKTSSQVCILTADGELIEQIKSADKRLEEIVKADKVVRRLCSVPGVGPVVATTFAATLDDASRILGAEHVRSRAAHACETKLRRSTIPKIV